MNIKRIYSKKVKKYNTLKRKDFARFADILFKKGAVSARPYADTADKRVLALMHEKGKVDERTIYDILRKAQLG